MSDVNRRKFIQYCIASAAALGLEGSVVGRLQAALAGEISLPTVIWLACSNCTGCTVSLANLTGAGEPTDVGDLLLNHVALRYHPNLMGAAGSLAVQTLDDAVTGPYILAVEGGVPTAFGGHTCMLYTRNGVEYTAQEAVLQLAQGAAAVLCIGTCSSFGGIPAGDPNPTGIMSIKALTGKSTINIPGCPAHPDWIAGTVATLLAGQTPQLDRYGRPYSIFGGEERNIHKNCPRKERDEAKTFGVEGLCMKELGCNGPETQGDCPTRLWNKGTNWCVGANSVCLGCTEPEFPDRFSPFYKHEGGGEDDDD